MKSTIIIEGAHFVQEVLAQLTGDKDNKVAHRNARMAISAVKGQIASLEGAKVKAENNVELAETKLHEASYPIKELVDVDSYISQLSRKKNELSEAKEKLEQIEETIGFYEELLDTFTANNKK